MNNEGALARNRAEACDFKEINKVLNQRKLDNIADKEAVFWRKHAISGDRRCEPIECQKVLCERIDNREARRLESVRGPCRRRV
jgi:hypothetical protein